MVASNSLELFTDAGIFDALVYNAMFGVNAEAAVNLTRRDFLNPEISNL